MLPQMRRFLYSLGMGVTLSLFMTLPLKAADRLYFIFGPLNLSLGIDSLEEFTETGNVNPELAFYFRVANADAAQQAAFREALTRRIDLENPVQLSRFFNSALGEEILTKIGNLLQIRGGRNGKYAIRGALVQSALDQENGLTLLNFLRHLPTYMQLNLDAIQVASRSLEALDRGTQLLIEEMERLTAEKAKNEQNIDFASLPDLTQPGNYGIAEREIWKLTDSTRNRVFNVLVYQPQRLREDKTPIIVISHGLGSRPEDFEHWGRHLASYGYVVALPQHIGSDTQQTQAFLTGLSREVFTVDEFINRPKDVSFVIDEFERRNQAEFGGRLDVENVGVAGHSFGGYNMLALGGATLNFENLDRTCNQDRWSPNVALLLQCRALDLPSSDFDLPLKDERVKAIITLNPVSGDIFGAEGLKNLKVPVAFAAGSSDPATPAALEQLRAFVWAGSQDKYFALVKGQAHVDFTRLDGHSQSMLDSFNFIVFPQQDILDRYAQIYTVAFFGRHLLNDAAYAPFLTPSYSQYISRSPHNIYVVNQAAAVPLSELFNRHRPRDRPPIYPPFQP